MAVFSGGWLLFRYLRKREKPPQFSASRHSSWYWLFEQGNPCLLPAWKILLQMTHSKQTYRAKHSLETAASGTLMKIQLPGSFMELPPIFPILNKSFHFAREWKLCEDCPFFQAFFCVLGQTIHRHILKEQMEAMHHLQLAQANSQITLFTATSMPREVFFCS